MDQWMTLIQGIDQCRAANASGIEAGRTMILGQILQLLQVELTIDGQILHLLQNPKILLTPKPQNPSDMKYRLQGSHDNGIPV